MEVCAFFTFSSLIIYFGLFLIRKTTALLTIFNMRESLFSFKGRLGPEDREIVKKSIRRIDLFKERKTKPKYSIRKYSIGAASALIGFMALANGQAAQADEAQIDW